MKDQTTKDQEAKPQMPQGVEFLPKTLRRCAQALECFDDGPADPAVTMHEAANAIDAYRADLTALRAAVPQWQPIETAPKDGTPVLVWESEYGREALTAAYIEFTDPPPDGYHSGWFDRVHGHSELQPTHWMPLPHPPTESK